MKGVIKKRELADVGQLQALVIDHVDRIEPGLSVLDSRLMLGQATMDIVGLDTDGALALIAVGFTADEEMLLRAVEAYSWCLEYPEAIHRLYPAARISTAYPPRLLFVIERMPDAFHRKIKQLGFPQVDCVEFRYLDVDGTPAVYFETLARLRRAPAAAPAPVERVTPPAPAVPTGRPTSVKLQKLLTGDRPAPAREPGPILSLLKRNVSRTEAPRALWSAPRVDATAAPAIVVVPPPPLPTLEIAEPPAVSAAATVAAVDTVTVDPRALSGAADDAHAMQEPLRGADLAARPVAAAPVAEPSPPVVDAGSSLEFVPWSANSHVEAADLEPLALQPTAVDAQPLAIEPEAVAFAMEPVAVEPEPSRDTVDRVAIEPEPIAVPLEPVASEPEPKGMPFEPVAIEMEMEPAPSARDALTMEPDPRAIDAQPWAIEPPVVAMELEPVGSDAATIEPVSVESMPHDVATVGPLELQTSAMAETSEESVSVPPLELQTAATDTIVTRAEVESSERPAIPTLQREPRLTLVDPPHQPLAPVAASQPLPERAAPAPRSPFARGADPKVSFADVAKDLLNVPAAAKAPEPVAAVDRRSVEEITRATLGDLVGVTDKPAAAAEDRSTAFAKPNGAFKRPRTIAPPSQPDPNPITAGKSGPQPKRSIAPAPAPTAETPSTPAAVPATSAPASEPAASKPAAESAVPEGFDGLRFPNDGVLTRQWMEFLNQMAAGK